MFPVSLSSMIVTFVLTASFFPFCLGSRRFHHIPMCNFSRKINDCSFQFPYAESNTCLIHKDCTSFNYTSWNLEPLSRPEFEADAEFIVTILPYAVYVDKIHKNSPFSAINITLTSLNEGIQGFSFVMSEDVRKRERCRIFDFRKAMDHVTVPFTFYYDCINRLVEDEWQDVLMVFTAHPLNTALSYYVHIPPAPQSNFVFACGGWKPLVMVFQGGLQMHHVRIKFSPAPEELQISVFNVTLINSSGLKRQKRVYAHSKGDMIQAEFYADSAGYYAIEISINFSSGPCTVSKTNSFFVGKETKDYSLLVFIILIILMIASAMLLIYYSCHWYIRNATPKSRPTLLLVYFYKQLHHEFLVTYSKYLENNFGVKVNLIYERSGNPKTWLEEKYVQSDIIVFVLSPSLKSLDQNHTEGEHHWVDQLAEAKALIDDTYIGKKKLCKICFSFSGVEDMPKCLKHQGPLFTLPKEFDKFLCFCFNCPKKLYVLSKLFRKNHHKVSKSNLKIDSDKQIQEKLDVLIEAENNYSPVSETKNVSEIKLNQEVKSIIIDACDYEVSKPPSKEDVVKKSEEFSKSSKLQESEVNEEENDDFMRYCVRKILYSD